MSTELDPDVRALIQAASAALDISLPAYTDEDERFYHQDLEARATVVKHALAAVLSGMKPSTGTRYISGCVSDLPVTYAAYAAEESVVFEVEQSGADPAGWDPDDPYGFVAEDES